jgi:hypothetical protein
MIKNRFLKLSLYLLLMFAGLVLTVTLAGVYLSSSGALMNVADLVQGIPGLLMFFIRLGVYASLYFALPTLIRKKRPTVSADFIHRARLLLLRILVVYEVLFGINLISILVGAAS